MVQQRIKLYQGSVNECSYLDEREAINIYADPHHPNPRAVYNQLIKKGFRRSGEYVYRPGCNDCQACVPVRIRCSDFQPRRTDKRNLKKNADLAVDFTTARYSDEYFDLYQRYLNSRHPGGGMDDPDATTEGLSAVYTFFDPNNASRGLGRFCILQQIELCKIMSMPYLYLGYWVDGCQKMQYKTDYSPQEHFDGNVWSEYEKKLQFLG